MHQVTQAEGAPVVARPFSTPKRYLNPKEAAEYLGIGHSTLSIHRMNGTGPAYIKWGPNVRYDIAALDGWMAERRVTPELKSEPAKRRVGRPRKQQDERIA